MVSVALFLEYEAVLTRPEHRGAGGYDFPALYQALDEFAAFAVLTRRHGSIRPYLDDPDDDMVLDAALAGGAEAIVTFETRTFSKAAVLGVAVLTPGQTCARIGA